MKNQRTYYQILHVQPDAPMEVIRSSYRTLMQKLKMHPDLGGCHENAAVVNEAYNVLINPTKRAEYDASLNAENEVLSKSKKTKQNNTEKNRNKFYTYTDVTQQCAFCDTKHNMGNNIGPDDVCTKCESPLFPATKQTEEIYGKRTIQRINKEWALKFYTSWPHMESFSGKTKDVSLKGIQLITAAQLEETQVVKITSNELFAVARVVNQQQVKNEWRYGLEFITLQFQRADGTFVSLEI